MTAEFAVLVLKGLHDVRGLRVQGIADHSGRHEVVRVDLLVPLLLLVAVGVQTDFENSERYFHFLHPQPNFLTVGAPTVVITKDYDFYGVFRFAVEAESRLRPGSAALVVIVFEALLV